MTGVRAIATAFPSARGFRPHPSRTISPASGTEEGDMPRRVAQGNAVARVRGYARLFLLDVRRLRPLRSLRHLEGDLVPFLQALEPVSDDGAVLHEHVRSARARSGAAAVQAWPRPRS